jgi:hypothetical protein
VKEEVERNKKNRKEFDSEEAKQNILTLPKTPKNTTVVTVTQLKRQESRREIDKLTGRDTTKNKKSSRRQLKKQKFFLSFQQEEEPKSSSISLLEFVVLKKVSLSLCSP